MSPSALLAADEPPAVSVYNENARSPFVIVCDHAGRALPRSLGDLGLTEEDRKDHIAWDIGAAGVAKWLADLLDAVLFLQHYSRLVIDCNRPLEAHDSIPLVTGGIAVPGNHSLSPAAVQTRVDSIFRPYHDRIRQTLASRIRPHILIAMHSFTPVLRGAARPFHAGVLYHADGRLAVPLLQLLRSDPELCVGENEPYAASSKTDYAIIEHAERHGAPYVEIEVRQDLITAPDQQRDWAERLARHLLTASAPFLG